MNLFRTIGRGAVAGAAATAPMSAVMLAANRFGAMNRQPPKRIVEDALDAAGMPHSEPVEKALAVVAHFGFGAVAGGLYTAVTPQRFRGVASGVGFGMLVWLVSYAGWIPALRILPPPPEDRPGRQGTMLVAHAVYGAALGRLARGRTHATHDEEEVRGTDVSSTPREIPIA